MLLVAALVPGDGDLQAVHAQARFRHRARLVASLATEASFDLRNMIGVVTLRRGRLWLTPPASSTK